MLLYLPTVPVYNITCFGIYLYSVGTNHRNLLKLLVTMNRLTYFVPQVYVRKPGLTELMQSKIKERIWKNEGEWTRKVEIRTRKKFLAVAMHVWLYSDLLQALKEV